MTRFCKRRKEVHNCNWCSPNICNLVRWTRSKDCNPSRKIIKGIIMDGKGMEKIDDIDIDMYFWACWSGLTVPELYVRLATRLGLQSEIGSTPHTPPLLHHHSCPIPTCPIALCLTTNASLVLPRFSEAQAQIIKGNFVSCGHYSGWDEQALEAGRWLADWQGRMLAFLSPLINTFENSFLNHLT